MLVEVGAQPLSAGLLDQPADPVEADPYSHRVPGSQSIGASNLLS